MKDWSLSVAVHLSLHVNRNAVCNVLISPAMGARFSQILITLESDGQCQGNTGNNQYFIYVVDGKASILIDERKHRLETGSYVYLPPAKDIQIKGGTADTRILIFQKLYKPLAGHDRPQVCVHAGRVAARG